MENIIKVAQFIMSKFPSVVCTTEDTCPDQIHYGDEDIEVGEDFNRSEWSVELRIEGNVTHEQIRDVLTESFGSKPKEFFRSDLKKNVNNYDVGNVHVVQLNNSIELSEKFEKVSKKR